MKKIIAVIISLFIILSAFAIGVGALPSETDSGILYSIENGIVTVEGFNYAGTVLDVPETIEGYPVKYVAAQACRGNYGITEVRLPSSLVSIGEYAFAECDNLTKVVLSGGVEIGYSAFRDCKALISLSLPEGLEIIDDSAFEGCTNLGKIKLPDSVTRIGTYAFMGCERVRFSSGANDYVISYAKDNGIPIGSDPWVMRVTVIAITSAVLLAVLLATDRAIKKRKKNK